MNPCQLDHDRIHLSIIGGLFEVLTIGRQFGVLVSLGVETLDVDDGSDAAGSDSSLSEHDT